MLLFNIIFLLPTFLKSQECHGKLPEAEQLVSVRVVTDGELNFVSELPIEAESTDGEGQMLKSSDNSCPVSCVYQIKSYIADHSASILHVREPNPSFVPPGYSLLSSEQFLCAREAGFCGAFVPLFRHYRMEFGKIYHAYSLNATSLYPNYTRESAICYLWPTSIMPEGLKPVGEKPIG